MNFTKSYRIQSTRTMTALAVPGREEQSIPVGTVWTLFLGEFRRWLSIANSNDTPSILASRKSRCLWP